MNKKQWESIKKRIQKLTTRRRVLELRKVLKKEKNKEVRIEIEKELTNALSLIPRLSGKAQVLITSESSSIETTAAEDTEKKAIRPELLRSLENILLTTPTPEAPETEQKQYGPSAKHYERGSYKALKYEDALAKYEPPRLLEPAAKVNISEYSPFKSDFMFEKFAESRKMEEESSKRYVSKKKEKNI